MTYSNKIVFSSNLDYYSTYERIASKRAIDPSIRGLEQSEKGPIYFWLINRPIDVSIQISPYGKVIVNFKTKSDLVATYKKLKRLCVAKGDKLVLEPTKAILSPILLNGLLWLHDSQIKNQSAPNPYVASLLRMPNQSFFLS